MTTQTYRVLPQIKAAEKPCYVMEIIDIESITADSPALQAMTDLSVVPTATTSPDQPLEQANSSMIQHGVRLLVVTGENGRIVGLITSTDILGQKPVQVAQQKGVKRGELKVADVMVPVGDIDILPFEEVRKARVGDVVATLQSAGRAHALVVTEGREGATSPRRHLLRLPDCPAVGPAAPDP
ncbi:CBS domain-containing protein [Azovibrio restrictus]|uniref:CBS domain-containing protein n=1 Tax=Azovibrio restrictus TaxID=146938 RepID=UPI0026EFFA35|nr:CBS domain-containing protein [Azovibrio restrictus]